MKPSSVAGEGVPEMSPFAKEQRPISRLADAITGIMFRCIHDFEDEDETDGRKNPNWWFDNLKAKAHIIKLVERYDAERDLVRVRSVSPSVDEAADASKEYVRGLEDAAKVVCGFCAKGVAAEFTANTYRHHLIDNETPWTVCRAESIRALISQHQETK